MPCFTRCVAWLSLLFGVLAVEPARAQQTASGPPAAPAVEAATLGEQQPGQPTGPEPVAEPDRGAATHAADGRALEGEPESPAPHLVADTPPSVPDFHRRGRSLFDAGDHAGAAEIYAQGVEQHPQAAILHAMLGLSQLHRGDARDAIDRLTRAAELAPGRALFQLGLGRAHMAQQQRAAALQAYEEAARLVGPDAKISRYSNALFLVWLGDAYLELGRAESAYLAYRRAASLDRHNREARLGWGRARALRNATADDDLAETPAQRVERRTSLEGGLRFGYGVPLGKATDSPGDELGNVIAGQAPIWVDAGVRTSSGVFYGLYFQYGIGVLGDELPCAVAVDCAVNDVRLGFQVQIRSDQGAWVGMGIGYEWHTIEASGDGGTVSATIRGLELFNLQLGIDAMLTRGVGIGPFLSFSLGQFSTASLDCGGECDGLPEGEAEIANTSVHGWVLVGARFVVGP